MNFFQICAYLIIFVFLVKLIDNMKNRKLYQQFEKFPSYPTYPLIGNAHLLLGPLEGLLARIEKLMHPFNRLVYWVGPIPLLCLKKHDDIAMVLSQSSDRDIYGVPEPWIGTGLLNARYEEWKKSRKMLSPAFSSDMLSKYLEVFNKNASNLVEKLKSVADIDQEVDISHILMNVSLDSIMENSLGIRIENGGKLTEDFCYAILEIMREAIIRVQWPFLLLRKVHMIYLKITGKIELINKLQRLPTKLLEDHLNDVRKFQCVNTAAHNDENSSKTMLDLLIKKGLKESSFTEIRIRDELLQMIAAATETSALTLSFLTLMLAINQDIQQKVYEEVKQLTADDHTLTENHLNNYLTYLDQCIKETLRMFSPVIVTGRRTHKEIILKDNTIIPANTLVAAHIHFANHDTDLYKNPFKWDPEHFNEQAVKERPKTSQLSFGYGPRSCIGAKYAMMSIKTQITHILRNYHLSTNIKEFAKENLQVDLSIRSKIGFPVKFTTRREVRIIEKK